jgi:hypothetical protein
MVEFNILYGIPELMFEELEQILMPDLKSMPADMPAIHRKVLEKLEKIMDTCPVKLIPDAIYDTCDYL